MAFAEFRDDGEAVVSSAMVVVVWVGVMVDMIVASTAFGIRSDVPNPPKKKNLAHF